jgi:hypothetical protein
MSDTNFRADDFIHALANWKLEPLTMEEKVKILDYLASDIDKLNRNEWNYGEPDIESFILHIISEE